MGGRQSSQNNTRQQTNVPDSGNSRYSVGSLDNEPSVSGRAVLFSGANSNVDLGAANVVRRRRRRDRNDVFIETHSLPAHLFPTALLTANIKCPVCSKRIASAEVESHLLVCLAKPKVSYNEDVLTSDAGECIICLDDMCAGDRIARLQCLCIYHKQCLDEWFQRNRCCPEHPDQAPQEYIETLPRSTAARPSRSALSPTLDSSIGEENEDLEEPPMVANSLPTILSVEHSPIIDIPNVASMSHSPIVNIEHIVDRDNPELEISESESPPNTSLPALDDGAGHSADPDPESPCKVAHSDGDSPRTTIHVGDDVADRSPTVHVDDGSMHGTTSLFNDEELAQLTSKKFSILVSENPEGNNEVNDT